MVGELSEKVFRKREDIVTREVAGETLLVPIRGDVADMQRLFVLHGVGEFVWANLDGRLSVGEIGRRVLDEYEVDREQAEMDVKEFLRELADAGLVEEAKT